MRRTGLPTAAGVFLLGMLGPSLRADSFVPFESGHVRPLALSASGDILLAVNTPDNRLEVFRATADGLAREGEVRVGLEPVAVAVDNQSRAYVVNHVSDTVSVVNFTEAARPFVERTLLVGDEPRDVVVAGAAGDKIFITTAHRGQNNPTDPQLSTPGIGRADVWVFERGSQAPSQIVTLFCDTPRALAASPDGTRVYAAAFHSGNRSTVLNEDAVDANLGTNNALGDGFRGLGVPEPTANDAGVEAPQVGVILKQDLETSEWRDAAGRDWSPRVRFNLPDLDVFEIDVTGDSIGADQIQSIGGVGTIIFNLAVHPVTGDIYASNLESFNEVRFEPVLRGHFVENRVTILDGPGLAGSTVRPVHLNTHIDYDQPFSSDQDIAKSLAMPLELVFSADGETLYVAAFGSAQVGVLDSAGNVLHRIGVGGGPSGLALDETRSRLYVMSRFDHAITLVDTTSRAQLATIPLRYDPEPAHVRVGRPVLYDSKASAHGDSSCASCHIFGDFDSLGWNLGDPAGDLEANPVERVAVQGAAPLSPFHPMKGPMTTQSLRGMDGAGPMHWRGDRNGVSSGAGTDPFDEGEAFLHFRPAFQGLLGKETALELSAMERFRDFILSVQYPPNPIAPIDGSLTESQAAGQEIFLSNGGRGGLGGDGSPCGSCHTLPFGTDGHGSFELEPQDFKVAHLRNLYQKVGMFGYAIPDVVRAPGFLAPRPTPHLGDQVRGFGFLHDGSVPTLVNFFRVPFLAGGFVIPPFTFPDEPGRSGMQKTQELDAFMMAFDTGLAPVVGHQVTLTAANLDADVGRYTTLRNRAEVGDCDLVMVLAQGASRRGFVYAGSRSFRSDRAAEAWSEDDFLAVLDAGAIVTATAVPAGSGARIGLDRDEDGAFDGDELEAGSDPADASSLPGPRRFLRGDCNGDGTLDITDPVAALFLFFSDTTPPPCVAACDGDGNGSRELTDAILVLDFLFRGGPPPGALPACEGSATDCAVDVCRSGD